MFVVVSYCLLNSCRCSNIIAVVVVSVVVVAVSDGEQSAPPLWCVNVLDVDAVSWYVFVVVVFNSQSSVQCPSDPSNSLGQDD